MNRREWIEETIDIILCNYLYRIVWKCPLLIHRIIRKLSGLTCYQYSSSLSKQAYRWEFRKEPLEFHLNIVETKFGYTNFRELSFREIMHNLIKDYENEPA